MRKLKIKNKETIRKSDKELLIFVNWMGMVSDTLCRRICFMIHLRNEAESRYHGDIKINVENGTFGKNSIIQKKIMDNRSRKS